MGLDKWIKPEKKQEEKKKVEKNEPIALKVTKSQKVSKISIQPEKDREERSIKFKKYILSCSKKGCHYQKTMIKRELGDKDKICPRCKSDMKIKEI